MWLMLPLVILHLDPLLFDADRYCIVAPVDNLTVFLPHPQSVSFLVQTEMNAIHWGVVLLEVQTWIKM
jgi:hypothetical protein